MISTTGYILIRVGIALFLGLFMVGVNFLLNSRIKKETQVKRYHQFNDRANPAFS
jgi:hypothetical protein